MRPKPATAAPPHALKRIDCVGTLIRRGAVGDEDILVVWNADWRAPAWSLPGGAREPGEGLREAAAREVREETGLAIEVGGLLDVHEKIGLGGRIHLVIFTFTGRVTGGSLICDGGCEPEQGGVTEARWIPIEEARGIPVIADVLTRCPPMSEGVRCTHERKHPISKPSHGPSRPGIVRTTRSA